MSGLGNFGKVGVEQFWKLGVGLGNFGKVGVEQFWKLGVRVGHFTFDSATLNCKPKRYSY